MRLCTNKTEKRAREALRIAPVGPRPIMHCALKSSRRCPRRRPAEDRFASTASESGCLALK